METEAVKFRLLFCAFASLLFPAFANADPLRIAGHAWTWKDGTVFEAIDRAHEVGLDALEVFLMGQKLSAETGGGNGHYGGKAEVYMDLGEAMGKAMVELLKK